MGRPEKEIEELRIQALARISIIFRNAPGTRKLAEEYGLSKAEVKKILVEASERLALEGEHRTLEPCYDPVTGSYLSFEEWLDLLIKKWDKLVS